MQFVVKLGNMLYSVNADSELKAAKQIVEERGENNTVNHLTVFRPVKDVRIHKTVEQDVIEVRDV